MDKFFGKSRKKVILICSIVIAIILFTGYFNYKKMIGDDEAQIPSDDVITKINNDSMNLIKTEKAEEQFDNPIDSYFLPLFDGSNYRTAAEYRNLQEIYGTVWQLEYKNLVLWLLSKCEFEEERKNIGQFDNCVKEYIDAAMSVIKTEKMDSYSFSPDSGDASRIGGTGTYGWMKYMQGKIYRDVCMFTIGVNDSDFSKYEFVNRDYSKLSMGSLYEELR